jgi:hypothetical protein
MRTVNGQQTTIEVERINGKITDVLINGKKVPFTEKNGKLWFGDRVKDDVSILNSRKEQPEEIL